MTNSLSSLSDIRWTGLGQRPTSGAVRKSSSSVFEDGEFCAVGKELFVLPCVDDSAGEDEGLEGVDGGEVGNGSALEFIYKFVVELSGGDGKGGSA